MREGNFNFKVYLAAALKIFKLRLLAIFLGDGRTDELLLCCTPLRVFQHCWSGDDGPQLAHTHTLARSFVRTTNTEGESETQSVVDLLLPWSRRSGFPFCAMVLLCVSNTPRRRRPCSTLLPLLLLLLTKRVSRCHLVQFHANHTAHKHTHPVSTIPDTFGSDYGAKSDTFHETTRAQKIPQIA